MNENLEEEAFKLMNAFRKITPILLMRKFKLNAEMANKLCDKISLRQHLEMRKFVKETKDGN
jgi:hypothetical protein